MTCAHCTLKLPSHFLNGLIHVSRSSIFRGEKKRVTSFFFNGPCGSVLVLGLVRLAGIPSKNHSSSSKIYVN
jgi:hypothetical protein